MSDEPKTILRHIIELREVLLRSSIAILIMMIISFLFIDEIFDFVSLPLMKAIDLSGKDCKLIYTSVSEIFSTHLKLSFYTGLSVCFPYISFQIWKFIKPGLRENEAGISRKFLFISIGLFIMGGIFAFCFVIPSVFSVFINTQTSAEFMPRISENVSFIMILIFSFGLSFQLPIVIYCLDRFGILRLSTIRKLWREVILAIVVLSAIITPPDAVSMAFLATPLIVLYFLSLVFCRLLR